MGTASLGPTQQTAHMNSGECRTHREQVCDDPHGNPAHSWLLHTLRKSHAGCVPICDTQGDVGLGLGFPGPVTEPTKLGLFPPEKFRCSCLLDDRVRVPGTGLDRGCTLCCIVAYTKCTLCLSLDRERLRRLDYGTERTKRT